MRWNAAPTTKLPVVVADKARRILTLMRWGLVPSWAKDLKIGYSTFNARAETLVRVISLRANLLRKDITDEELRALADFNFA